MAASIECGAIMRFQDFAKRTDWLREARELGYLSTILDNPPYWVEAIEQPFCGVFSSNEIEDEVKEATFDLYQLALYAVEIVVNSPNSEMYFDQLKIPNAFREPVRKSWLRRDRTLYGRFDFSYSTSGLKLLELNFDTPTSLYEAAVLQWFWLEDLKKNGTLGPDCSQFNELHERLIDTFRQLIRSDCPLHLTTIDGCIEDEETVRYLQSCAMQAGLQTEFLYLKDVGLDRHGYLLDHRNRRVEQLFKLYPWEFIVVEDLCLQSILRRTVFPKLIESQETVFFEPAWKMILSNKGILPIMWQIAPEHPYLLESSFNDMSSRASALRNAPHVRKPVFGREGGSVSVIIPGEKTISNESTYGEEGFILQAYHQLPKHANYHIVLGSWVIDDQPAGVGLRADSNPITTNTALFVPHYIEEPMQARQPEHASLCPSQAP